MQKQVYVICYDTGGRVCRKPLAQASLEEQRFCDRVVVGKNGVETFLSARQLQQNEATLNRQFTQAQQGMFEYAGLHLRR